MSHKNHHVESPDMLRPLNPNLCIYSALRSDIKRRQSEGKTGHVAIVGCYYVVLQRIGIQRGLGGGGSQLMDVFSERHYSSWPGL